MHESRASAEAVPHLLNPQYREAEKKATAISRGCSARQTITFIMLGLRWLVSHLSETVFRVGRTSREATLKADTGETGVELDIRTKRAYRMIAKGRLIFPNVPCHGGAT
jgi:hypothetical protein